MSSSRDDRGSGDARALVLTRVFDAPPDAVFALWSDPAQETLNSTPALKCNT